MQVATAAARAWWEEPPQSSPTAEAGAGVSELRGIQMLRRGQSIRLSGGVQNNGN